MVDETKRQEILQRLIDGVVEFDEDGVKATSEEAIGAGLDAYDAIMSGLAAGMEKVGELWDNGEYFVPEVLLSSDALYAGLEILQPHVELTGAGNINCDVVIGTVQGDIHDIGKNLVKMMLDVAGFTVHDLGQDVAPDAFVEEQVKTGAQLVCLSTMMTTTMMGMKKIIEMIRAKNPDVKIMIGGAPITADTVQRFGADATADSAPNALREAMSLIGAV
ncbi:MAG: cobalamin-dependent protein [Gammaproteobacteria bacterium]|nr:cobalamin-dependent protein [Gammaproteobacteria bacterium]